MRGLILSLIAALVLAAASCGGSHSFQRAADFPSEQQWTLSSSQTGPEVDRFVRNFYDETFDRAAVEGDLNDLLEQYPTSWELHHVAGYLAMLRGDTHGTWSHFLSAAADLRCPYPELFLWEALREPRIVSEYNGTIELLRLMSTEHPSPSTRLTASRVLIEDFKRFGRLGEARAASEGLGFLDQWMVIGAFENDQGSGFITPFAPEESIDIDEELQGRLQSVSWRPVELIDDVGRVPLSQMVSPNHWSVAYLLTYVHSEAERTVQLRLTTGTAVRAFLNDALVISEEHVEGGDYDNIVVQVTLNSGWNKLLIKSASRDRDGDWYVGAFITDEEGVPLGDLRSSRDPQSTNPVSGGGEPSPLLTVPSALSEASMGHMGRVLSVRYLVRAGLDRGPLPLAQQLVSESPNHPLHLFLAAHIHWKIDELGRTIDLLNRAVAQTEDWGGGVLVSRATFYRHRGLLDRALRDLEAATAGNPDARTARMRLAELFERRRWHEDRCRVLDDVIARWPDSGWALRDMGSCMQSRQYHAQAEQWFLRAQALEPGHEWGLSRLVSSAIQRHDFDSAIVACNSRRNVVPTRTTVLTDCGEVRRVAGRREEARNLFEEASRRDPDWSLPFSRLATMAYEDGDDERALELWRSALERNPDNTILAERLSFLESDQLAIARRYVPTDEVIEAHVTRARDIEALPGAHRIAVFDNEVTVVRGDGSSDRTITQIWKVVTTDGRDRLLRYDAPRNARILQAYTRDPDGGRQEASSIREGTVRFRRLDIGSVVVVQYISHDRPGRFLPNHFISSWWFNGQNWQREGGEWVILLPRGRQLSFHITGDIDHEHETAEDWEVHTFSSSSLPPLIPEYGSPPLDDVVAHVSVSTVSSWDLYIQWERALLNEAFETAPELRALAHQLTEGAPEPRERLDRLFRFVAQEIRYQQDYEDTIAGVRPHSSTVVLERRYGDCKDKAVLLIQLAREVGVDVHYALLRTLPAGRVEPEVPNQQFNHAIVYVPEQQGIEEGFFMDPTTDGLDIGTLRRDDQGALSLVLNTETGEHSFMPIPYQSPEHNRDEYVVEASISSATEARAHVRYEAVGSGAAWWRQRLRNPGQERMFHSQLASQVLPGSRVLEGSQENHDDIVEPIVIELDTDMSGAIQPSGENLQLPLLNLFDMARLANLEERTNPIQLSPPEVQSLRVVVELPERGRFIQPPPVVGVEHECFTVTQHSQVEGRQITVEQRYERTCTFVSTDDYPEFRVAVQRAANQLTRQLVFTLPR